MTIMLMQVIGNFENNSRTVIVVIANN
jgi:hypothetical protein